MIADDRKRYEQAREAGKTARRNGAKIGANTYRGTTKLVRDLHSEWELGWRAEDMARRAAK